MRGTSQLAIVAYTCWLRDAADAADAVVSTRLGCSFQYPLGG